MLRGWQVPEFGDKMASGDKLTKLFRSANDDIASRKLPAALAIANMAGNKNLRVKLVKHRAYQLFVEMGKVGSLSSPVSPHEALSAPPGWFAAARHA